MTATLTVHPAAATEAKIAEAASRAWAAVTLRKRLAILKAMRHAIAADAQSIAQQVTDELPQRIDITQTLASEVLPLLAAIKFLEKDAPAALAPIHLGAAGRPAWLWGARSAIHREPKGVVLIICPFNYPLLLAGVSMVQALAAGNVVLLKPGKHGSVACKLLAQYAHDAGVPRDALHVLESTIDAGLDAIDSGHVDHVVMTGSATAGKAILARCADKLITATLELSGCDSVFVLPEADLDHLTRAMRFGLSVNSGATCIAPRRLYVTQANHDQVCQSLRKAMIDHPAVAADAAAADKLRTQVAQAFCRGAVVLAGGFEKDGSVRPIVLANVSPSDPILTQDLFAPVISIVKVESMDQALRFNDACPYALGASVFGPQAAAADFASRVNAGSVSVNDLIVPTADPRLPFGGWRESGIGVTRGRAGLLELTRIRTITRKPARLQPHLQPPTPDDASRILGLIQLTHCATWRERLAALRDLFRKPTADRTPSTPPSSREKQS